MNRTLVSFLAWVLLTGCVHGSSAVAEAPVRGRAFWLSLRDAKFPLPVAAELPGVLHDAVSLVDAADPQLRDDVGYGLVVQWVYRDKAVPPDVLQTFTAALLARLQRAPDAGPNAVLGRSFSALSLSIVAAAEVQKPSLSGATFNALVDAGCAELAGESDLRGHDVQLGWLHATAHTADLLKFLGRDSRLTAAQQGQLFIAITQRLARGEAFVWGEDERLAGPLRSLVVRNDARLERFEPWLQSLLAQWKTLWNQPVLDRTAYAQLNNSKLTLRVLLLTLPAEPTLEPFKQRLLDVLLNLS